MSSVGEKEASSSSIPVPTIPVPTGLFRKYPSFDNLPPAERRRALIGSQCEQEADVWVVTEKIHGTNASVILSFSPSCSTNPPVEEGKISLAKAMFVASRNNIVAPLESLEPKALVGGGVVLKDAEMQERLHQAFHQTMSYMETPFYNNTDGGGIVFCSIHVFGELYGPGIQKSTRYSTKKGFCVFDIEVVYEKDGEESNDDGDGDGDGSDSNRREKKSFFLPIAKVQEICHKSGLQVTETLFTGTLQECIAYSSLYLLDNTTIPSVMGMPDLEPYTREGHVLRIANPLIAGSFGKRWKHKGEFEVVSGPSSVYKFVNKERLLNLLSKDGGDMNCRTRDDWATLLVEDAVEEVKQCVSGSSSASSSSSSSTISEKRCDDEYSKVRKGAILSAKTLVKTVFDRLEKQAVLRDATTGSATPLPDLCH